MKAVRARALILTVIGFAVLPAVALAQSSYAVVANVCGTTKLLEAGDGTIYGTSYCHERAEPGTIFKMTAAGTVTPLHAFSGGNGRGPRELLLASDGNLYGATSSGGANDKGTIFRFTLAGTFETLHSFSGVDGSSPSSLFQASDGNLYGITVRGGASNAGTIFRITLVGALTTLHVFNRDDGEAPTSLIEASDGNLYGTTYWGGADGDGVVFKLDTAGALTVLFQDFLLASTYGGPVGLVEGRDGFYGAAGEADGKWFWVDGSGNFDAVSFGGTPDGPSGPDSGLIRATDGGMYGASYNGGATGSGTIYRLEAGFGVSIVRSLTQTGCDRGAIVPLEASDGSFYSAGRGCIVRFRPRPDLVVSSIGLSHTLLSPGSSFYVTDKTTNIGSIYQTGESLTRYFLSADAVRSSDDLRIGARVIRPLGPRSDFGGFAFSTGSVGITLKASTAVGTYKVLACADDGDLTVESDEDNNCTASGEMTVALSDLIEAAITAPPASLTPGAKFSVTDSVLNSSVVVAGASTSRYYMSLNTTLDPGDQPLSTSRSISTLVPGASSSGAKTLTVPTTLPAGVDHVLACADDRRKVRESNESNNCIASTTTAQVGWADLTVTAVTSPPPSVSRGAKFAVTDSVSNQGTVSSTASAVRYYLSVGAAKSAGDVALTPTRSVPILTPNGVSSGQKNVTVPTGMAAGSYYLVACADDLGKVNEGNETNNCRPSLTTVLVQ